MTAARPWRRWHHPAAIGYLLPVAVGVVYVVIAVVRHARNGVGIDAAIFYQAISNYAHLRVPEVPIKSVEPFNILGDHFSPAMILFAPLVAIFPSVLTLLIAQAVMFALAVAVVLRTAEALGLERKLQLLVAAAYGLSAGMVEAAEFDFHEVSLTVPVAALALSLLLRGREAPGIAALLSTLLIREDNAFLVMGVGLSFLAARRWRSGAALIVVGAASFLLITGVIIPWFSYYGKYTYWTDGGVHATLSDTLPAVLRNLSGSLSPDALPATMAILLLSFLFLPLRSRWALAAVIFIALRAASPNPAYWALNFHYNAILSTIFAFATLAALDSIPNSVNPRVRFFRLTFLPATLVVLVAGVFLLGPANRYLRPSTYSCDRCAQVLSLVRSIPDGAPVAADNRIVALLVERHPTYLAAPEFVDSAGRPMDTEWVLLDLRSAARPEAPHWAEDLYRQLTLSDRYSVTRVVADYVLLHRAGAESLPQRAD